MTEFWIYNIICPEVDISNDETINMILRRMVEIYCYSDKDKYNILDEFISFHEFNTLYNSVPRGTNEAFGDIYNDFILEDWEIEAIYLEDKIVKDLHIRRGPYKKLHH